MSQETIPGGPGLLDALNHILGAPRRALWQGANAISEGDLTQAAPALTGAGLGGLMALMHAHPMTAALGGLGVAGLMQVFGEAAAPGRFHETFEHAGPLARLALDPLNLTLLGGVGHGVARYGMPEELQALARSLRPAMAGAAPRAAEALAAAAPEAARPGYSLALGGKDLLSGGVPPQAEEALASLAGAAGGNEAAVKPPLTQVLRRLGVRIPRGGPITPLEFEGPAGQRLAGQIVPRPPRPAPTVSAQEMTATEGIPGMEAQEAVAAPEGVPPDLKALIMRDLEKAGVPGPITAEAAQEAEAAPAAAAAATRVPKIPQEMLDAILAASQEQKATLRQRLLRSFAQEREAGLAKQAEAAAARKAARQARKAATPAEAAPAEAAAAPAEGGVAVADLTPKGEPRANLVDMALGELSQPTSPNEMLQAVRRLVSGEGPRPTPEEVQRLREAATTGVGRIPQMTPAARQKLLGLIETIFQVHGLA